VFTLCIRVYIGAALGLSSVYGIPGLIYANCLNMVIRIVTSLLFAFQHEKDPRLALRTFLRDLVSVDVKFIIGIIKQRLGRGDKAKGE
jgi:Rft protein